MYLHQWSCFLELVLHDDVPSSTDADQRRDVRRRSRGRGRQRVVRHIHFQRPFPGKDLEVEPAFKGPLYQRWTILTRTNGLYYRIVVSQALLGIHKNGSQNKYFRVFMWSFVFSGFISHQQLDQPVRHFPVSVVDADDADLVDVSRVDVVQPGGRALQHQHRRHGVADEEDSGELAGGKWTRTFPEYELF